MTFGGSPEPTLSGKSDRDQLPALMRDKWLGVGRNSYIFHSVSAVALLYIIWETKMVVVPRTGSLELIKSPEKNNILKGSLDRYQCGSFQAYITDSDAVPEWQTVSSTDDCTGSGLNL